MNFGVAFTFDPHTDAAVRRLWQVLADAGLSDFMLNQKNPPHMTAFGAEAFDRAGLADFLRQFAAATPSLPVTFPSLGVFPAPSGVVYLCPSADPALVDLHARLWTAAGPFVHELAHYYAPPVWAPHVTLGFQLPPGVLGAAVEILAAAALPVSGRITGLFFGEFHTGGGGIQEHVLFRD